MRLAHFIHRYPPALGGAEAYFARLSRWCVQQGDEVTVFTSNAQALEAFWSSDGTCLPEGVEDDAGVTVHRYPLWTMPGRRWLLKALSFFPNHLWQCLTMPCNPISSDMWHDAGNPKPRGERSEPLGLRDAIPSPPAPLPEGEGRNARPFDAVHASAFPYAFPIVCARRLARRLDIPLFITPFLHLGDPDDPDDPTRRAYTSPELAWLLDEADGVFVQTPSERDAAIALGLAPEKVVLQGLGIDAAECTGGDRFAARERWNIPPDAVVVGHLANNSWEKGTNDLLEAMTPLLSVGHVSNVPRSRVKGTLETCPTEIQVLLAGPQMPNFTQFWQSFKARVPSAARCVHQLGPISDAEKRDFFAAIDIFALPSRSDSFGLVLLEAWANGVPNVGYRAGGVADVIRDNVDGLLVRCGDIDGLTRAIQRLADDIDFRVRLGIDGKARLSCDFRWASKLALVRETIVSKSRKISTRHLANVVN
ncbi:MAG: glycosyltransferase family 4 protein [Planctomycetes bacterium]|nr:glycosyltransferase family 4 protein [Planctomycetota bacterium]